MFFFIFFSSQSLDNNPPPRAWQWSTISHSVCFLALKPLFFRRHFFPLWFTPNQALVALRIQPLHPLASSQTYDLLSQEANPLSLIHVLKHCKIMGVTSPGPHTRPTCHQALRGTFNKTMRRMWIERLCVSVLFPMGSREFVCPNMGIVTSHKSHGLNTRCWLVDSKNTALWLVTAYRSLHHYLYIYIYIYK